ncbi:MAG: family 65 glycosyl hydrolase, partial [Actinobacteria bacterium]
MADAGCGLCAAELPAEWVLSYQDGDPSGERARETMLTVGNGYLATRGAAPEAVADAHHYPGTYVAGVYNRLTSTIDGQSREDESIVNLPNWLPVTFRPVRGEWFAPGVWDRVHEHTALDLRHGVMSREIVVVDDQGRRTRIRQRRLASMAAPHIAALETRIIPENWSGRVELRIALDGRVENTNVPTFAGLASQHLNVIETGCDGANLMWLVAETVNSKLRIAEVARTLIYQGGLEQRADRRTLSEPGFIGQGLEVDIGEGEEVVIDKCVAIFTSRDRAIAEPLVAAREEIAHSASFDDLLHAHAAAWHRLWQRFRVGLDDRDDMRLPVNVHIFHLLQTLSPHTADLDAGVPAAGLHGESYRGHIFWDELFVFPFLNFRLPELTRALLRYRHRRLPQARRRAAARGGGGRPAPGGGAPLPLIPPCPAHQSPPGISRVPPPP